MKPSSLQAGHPSRRRDEGAAVWLEVASQSARKAAAQLPVLAQAGRTERPRGQRAAWRDIKIEADAALEGVIGDELRAHSPWPILSEERAAVDRAQDQDGMRWIVDPLDGSLNFSRAIPLSCISIALWRGRVPVLGVIHDVNRGEHFTGLVGSGAWLNGKRIHVSRVSDPHDAVLCTGFPLYRDYGVRSLERFVRDIRRYKRIRMLGSAALSLAYVACGRADLYQEEAIALWDVAAGIALVEAAGGKAERAPVEAPHCVTVRAANPDLLEQMERVDA